MLHIAQLSITLTSVFFCQLHWLPIGPPFRNSWTSPAHSSLFSAQHIFFIYRLLAKTYCLPLLVCPPHTYFFENLKAKTWKLLRVLSVIPLILQSGPFLFCMTGDPLVCSCCIAMIWVKKAWCKKIAEGFSIDFWYHLCCTSMMSFFLFNLQTELHAVISYCAYLPYL